MFEGAAIQPLGELVLDMWPKLALDLKDLK